MLFHQHGVAVAGLGETVELVLSEGGGARLEDEAEFGAGEDRGVELRGGAGEGEPEGFARREEAVAEVEPEGFGLVGFDFPRVFPSCRCLSKEER